MPIDASPPIEARGLSKGPGPRGDVLAIVVLFSSSAALAVELAAARLLAPLVGMSLFTWTAIITVVLAGFSVGHWIGGVMASGAQEPERASRWLALTLVLAGMSVVAAVAGLPLAPVVIDLAGGVRVTTVLVLAAALFFIPSLAAGVISPLATAMAVEQANTGDRGRILARMFAASAAGAILGVLGTGYALIPLLGGVGAMAFVAGLQALLGGWVWREAGGTARAVIGGTVIMGMAIAGSLALTRPICDAESQYYCLKEVDTTALTAFPSRGLKIDGWLHSVEATDGGDRLFIESHDFVDSLVRRDQGGLAGLSALFIGGGGLTLPDLWRRSELPDRLWVLEIDPAVSAFAVEHMSVKIEAPLRVIHDDGRAGLRGLPTETRFGVIYNDAYTGLTMPAHLVTREFHARIRGRLTKDGLYVVNLIDAPRNPRFLASLVETLRRDFGRVEIWRKKFLRSGNRRMHYGVVARMEPSGFANLESRTEPSRHWKRLDDAEVSDLLAGTNAIILRDDLAPVDRLLANFCSLAFLRVLSLDLTRADACQ